MKNIILILLCLSLFSYSFTEEKCLIVDKAITKQDFKLFTKLINESIKDLKMKKLKVVENNENTMLFSTNEYTYKIKRRHPAIGKLPKIKKAKWKKEKISIKAKVNNNAFCLNFDAYAYNRKDKKWHELNAPDNFYENILDRVYLNSIKESVVYTVGSPLAIVNGLPEKITNLEKFTIKDANITFSESKAVEILLQNDEGKVITASIPYIGDVKTVLDIYKVFSKNFVKVNPKDNVSKNYDFFWEYAIHGEIMDGMHKNQLITAFGLPYRIEKTNNSENMYFLIDGKELVFKIFNDELNLPDDYNWKQ